jgi:hypothetical protein
MPQGNAFGRSGGRWMTTAKLRALFNSGHTYDEIAAANLRSEGWRPSRSAVKKKLDLLNFPPRNKSHHDLIPWRVRPEHNSSELRHMLQAESRRRQLGPGEQLSDTDRTLVSQLDDHLFGRGRMMVVTYHPDIGFGLVPREDNDEDIVRMPPRRDHDQVSNKSALIFAGRSSRR